MRLSSSSPLSPPTDDGQTALVFLPFDLSPLVPLCEERFGRISTVVVLSPLLEEEEPETRGHRHDQNHPENHHPSHRKPRPHAHFSARVQGWSEHSPCQSWNCANPCFFVDFNGAGSIGASPPVGFCSGDEEYSLPEPGGPQAD